MRSAEGLAVALGLALLAGLLATMYIPFEQRGICLPWYAGHELRGSFLDGVVHLLVASQAVVLI
jgi:hypothetical protein